MGCPRPLGGVVRAELLEPLLVRGGRGGHRAPRSPWTTWSCGPGRVRSARGQGHGSTWTRCPRCRHTGPRRRPMRPLLLLRLMMGPSRRCGCGRLVAADSGALWSQGPLSCRCHQHAGGGRAALAGRRWLKERSRRKDGKLGRHPEAQLLLGTKRQTVRSRGTLTTRGPGRRRPSGVHPGDTRAARLGEGQDVLGDPAAPQQGGGEGSGRAAVLRHLRDDTGRAHPPGCQLQDTTHGAWSLWGPGLARTRQRLHRVAGGGDRRWGDRRHAGHRRLILTDGCAREGLRPLLAPAIPAFSSICVGAWKPTQEGTVKERLPLDPLSIMLSRNWSWIC